MTTLVIAPHPDDETLGCGGTLLAKRRRGETVHWLIVTAMDATRVSAERRAQRKAEISAVAEKLGGLIIHRLDLPTAHLDRVEEADLIASIGAIVHDCAPQDLFVPWIGDPHGDHRAVFLAAAACTKWFRYESVRRVLAYEVASETDQALRPPAPAFQPNLFIDITETLNDKIAAASIYASEMGTHPFPRSTETLRALAQVRGAQAGFAAAEAFMILRQRQDDPTAA